MAKRYRTYVTALILLLSAGQALRAQGDKAELFGGVAFSKADPETPLPRESITGWVGSAAGYLNHWFGVGVEISGQFGTIPAPSSLSGTPGLPFKEYSYVAGPQFRFLNQKRVQSSFRLMVGGVFGQVNLSSSATPQQISQLGASGYGGFNQTKFAALFAVPVDVSVSKLIAIRVEPGLYLTNFNMHGQGNFRFSVGPVFRFGEAAGR
jgi:hypothetical protein